MTTFIRFVSDKIDHRSGRRQGLFAAAYDLRASGRLSASDEARLDVLRDWFSDELAVPDRLSISRKPHRKSQAICWFRDDAHDCIARMRRYAEVLDEYDVLTDMVRTKRPGFIVYSDDHQVAAFPFADTPT